MGKLVAIDHVTLDGVMQGPGRSDEDVREGFAHGGWAHRNADEVMGRVMGQGMSEGGGPLLFGRRTYEDFHGFWPHQTDNPYTDVLNAAQKYVASRTLTEPLPWQNSILLQGEVADAVAGLKERSEKAIVALGSGTLLGSLMPHGLIDTYLLMIHPLILGTGRRLFPDDGPHTTLRLRDSVTTTTGVIIATYEAQA